MRTRSFLSSFIRSRVLGKCIRFGHAPFLLLLVIAISVLTVPCFAAEQEGGPRQLLITYRSQRADRPAFRAYLQGEESVTLDKLKNEGVLKSYQILFNPFVTTGTWDAMMV